MSMPRLALLGAALLISGSAGAAVVDASAGTLTPGGNVGRAGFAVQVVAVAPTPVPEPGSLALAAVALAAGAAASRRRRTAPQTGE